MKFDEDLFRIYYREVKKFDESLTDGMTENQAVKSAKKAFNENLKLAKRMMKRCS